MSGESSATTEVVIGATESALAGLVANGLDSIGIDFASFGVVAFDKKSGGKTDVGLDGFGVIGTKDTALGVQDGALKLFGFYEFTIPLESAAQIAGSYESVGIIG